jgi:hypothetical protein
LLKKDDILKEGEIVMVSPFAVVGSLSSRVGSWHAPIMELKRLAENY